MKDNRRPESRATTRVAGAHLLAFIACIAAGTECGGTHDLPDTIGGADGAQDGISSPNPSPDDATLQDSDAAMRPDGSVDGVADASSSIPLDTSADQLGDGSTEMSPDGDGGFDEATDSDADAPAAPWADAYADADAPADGDAASVIETSTTASVIDLWLGPDCLACAEANCFDAGTTCEGLGAQLARAGMAVGQPRIELCLDTLDCMGQTLCYEDTDGVTACFCGGAVAPSCLAQGPRPFVPAAPDCIAVEQRGLETTDAAVEFDAQYDESLGAGVANALIECIKNVPCGNCLP